MRKTNRILKEGRSTIAAWRIVDVAALVDFNYRQHSTIFT